MEGLQGSLGGLALIDIHEAREPTTRELSLARRISELETSNAALQAQLNFSSPSASPSNDLPILIPGHLIPLLSQLRAHVAGLTADNKALSHLLYSGTSQPQWPEHNVDLSLILERVKKLTRENEELGDMVLEAGKVGGSELEAVLRETADVIASLEKELEARSVTMKAQETELAAYKARFGPLTAQHADAPVKSERSQGGVSRGQGPHRGRRRPQ